MNLLFCRGPKGGYDCWSYCSCFSFLCRRVQVNAARREKVQMRRQITDNREEKSGGRKYNGRN